MQEEHLTAPPIPASSRLTASLARDEREVAEAQRLRFEVFAGKGPAPAAGEPGRDEDAFDPYCEHVLVRDGATGSVVGTYRLLSAARAAEAGRFSSEAEFDLDRLTRLPRLVEVGRACVHPDYEEGAVLALLWRSLARLIALRGYDYAIGCASLPAAEPAPTGVARLCDHLLREYLSPPQWRVVPRRPFPLAGEVDSGVVPPVPTLLRGYLSMGGYVCGEPAFCRDSGTVHLLVLLPIARLRVRDAHRLSRAA
jgi:putative hemolysin